MAAALSVLKMRRGVVVSALDLTCGERVVGLGAPTLPRPSAAVEFRSPPALLLLVLGVRGLKTSGCVFWCWSSNIRSGSAPWYHCGKDGFFYRLD